MTSTRYFCCRRRRPTVLNSRRPKCSAGAARLYSHASAPQPSRGTTATKARSLWLPDALGPIGFNLPKLPATAAMLDAVLHERDAAADIVKIYFNRRRPWTFNDAIQVCEAPGRNGSHVRAYPSGHGTLAYAQGVILAHLMPNRGQVIMSRAEDFAESRMICGVHSRSDIRASAVLGTTIGMLLLHNAKFRPLLDASRAELAAAFLDR